MEGLIETITMNSGKHNLELVYDEETNIVDFKVDEKVVLSCEFGNLADELFHRAICLWSKKYSGKTYDTSITY